MDNKEELVGNLNKNNIVQKSNSLHSLWKSDLTLAEFKIIDTYLSRIDSHNPDQRIVTFSKGELEKLLDVKKINNSNLKKRLINLMGNVVEISDREEKRGFQLITLFEEADAEQDDSGLWKIKLECTQKAMKYIFNIENIGYLRYKIRSIINIKSLYSYIMFNYIESNRYRITWEISVEELKVVLNCQNEETYKVYKRFNDLILKKAYQELNEKTECKYSYEPIKKGRNVIAIKFNIKNIAPMDNKECQLSFKFEGNEKSKYEERLEFFNNACENIFTKKEMAVILDILKTSLENDFYDDIKCYDYLESSYNLLLLHDERKHIKDKFAYFKKIIEIKEDDE